MINCSSCFSFIFSLWIWEHAIFTLLCRLRCPLNLSPQQLKVSSELSEKWNTKAFWSENFGLLGIKYVQSQPDFLGWYLDSWPYIVSPRVKPQDRNTHAMLCKFGGVRQLKHGESGLQIIAFTGRTDLYFTQYPEE